MNLDEWIEQRYTRPVVLVESSAAADAVCGRHGLDTIQLLRPHSVYTGGPLSARTGERSDPVTCSRFGVRLMRTDCVRDVALSQVTRHLRRLMRGAAAMDMAYGEQFDRALESIVVGGRSRRDGSLPHPVRAAAAAAAANGTSTTAAPSPSSSTGGPSPPATLLERAHPSWHRAFVRDFHSLVRCSSFDTIDHPVGVLFAVATSEVGGVEGILQVFRAQAKRVAELKASLPGMDGELHHYYLILHDNTSPSSPSLSTARQVLTAVQQLYGANYCALIKVNSVLDPRLVKSLDPSLWVDASPAVMDVPSAQAVQRAAAAAASSTTTTATVAAAPVDGGDMTTSVTSVAATSVSSAPDPAAAVAAVRSGVVAFRTVAPTCGTWPDSTTPMLTGCFMSPEDVTEVHNVMAYYLSQSLFKFIERRLRMLDVSVQERRTTTLGKMAAWFKGKDEVRPRTADVVLPPRGSDPSVMPKYVASSLEMQMRHCADLSLALHDYEGAIVYYKMCLDELLETLGQRPYNRSMIAACQEGYGVAQLLLRRAPPPSLTPWYTGVTSAMHRISSQTNRWEVAWNDYLAAGTQTYAARLAFLLYECCRTRAPPLLDRCRAILLHLQRSGILQRQNLLSGAVNDMLAGVAIFSNAPYAAGLAAPPTIPRDYPMMMSVRRFARHLQQAGAFYRADNSLDQALRCYLRVLELLRLVDPQETWTDLAEHLYLVLGQLYTHLGQDVRGIAMASAAVARGTPLYRRPETAQQAFEAFWAQQRQVLAGMGYALCPHMPMPRIVRASFHVDRNYYGTDGATDEVARRMSEAMAEAEWREMERRLKKSYTETVLKTHPQYRFPPLHGGSHHHGGGGAAKSKDGGGGGHTTTSTNTTNGGAGGGGSPTHRRPGAHGGGGGGGAAARNTSYDYIFSDLAAPGDAPRTQRHYTIAKAEPLVLSFVMENTIGCPLEATDLTLLYLAHTAPDQLWKSSTTQTVRLAAGARQRVSLSFDPVAEGEYAIIGLCWSLMGQEGYYYFATRESRPGCPESLYEYAIEHPMPTLEAPENIHVTVQPSKACVTATFHPRLPDHLYDGEYFATKLVVHNTSAHQDAAQVVLQRSPTAAHLLYIDELGLAKNLDLDAPLLLAEHLKAQETRTFTVTVRGQHRRGDVALQSSGNYFFLLLAYLPGAPQEPERRLDHSLKSPAETDAASAGTHFTAASSPASGVVSPTLGKDGAPPSSPLSGGKFPGHGPPAMVRLHRLLRRCDVQPVLAMYSTVLPPSNASLRTAIVLTAKNICTSAAPRLRSTSLTPAGSTLSPTTPNDAVRAIPVLSSSHGDGAVRTSASASLTGSPAPPSSSYVPLRIARVLAVHSPRWGVECDSTEELVAERAAQCLLSHGDCLTFALLVKRQPRGVGEADTTARHVFLNRASAAADDETDAAPASPACPYTDTTCLALPKALPSPSRVRAVETTIGSTVSQSSRNLFFLQTSCLGPGRVGAQALSDDAGGGGLAFYADKGGQQKAAPKSAAQRRRDEVAEERRLCGSAMEQYTPLALAVTWVRESSDGLRRGQLFLFVDPIEHIYQTVAQQQKRQQELESAAVQLRSSAVGAGGGSAAAVEQVQQELCDAMLVRYASLKPWLGAVVSHVHVPPMVRATGGATAEIPVTLRCMSLAPVPLLVTAEALPPSAPAAGVSWEGQRQNSAALPPLAGASLPGSPAALSAPASSTAAAGQCSSSSSSGEVPVLFVGKTLQTFLLMPSEEFEVRFTAHALRPGLVDCQRITLRAASMCFVHGTIETDEGNEGATMDEEGDVDNASLSSITRPLMRTGMTLPSLVRALLERRAPSFTASASSRVVLSAQQLFESSGQRGEGESDGAGSSLDHWKSLARTVHGRAEAAAPSSVTMLVERYGARAAEVLRQLSPRGPAAGATVSQVIPQTAPALTRVEWEEGTAGCVPAVAAGVVGDNPISPPLQPTQQRPTTAVDTARKFFRQLEAFEAEVQRAAQASAAAGSPADPLLHQYIYRPTVKSLDGGVMQGSFTANSSLVLSRSVASALRSASLRSSTMRARPASPQHPCASPSASAALSVNTTLGGGAAAALIPDPAAEAPEKGDTLTAALPAASDTPPHVDRPAASPVSARPPVPPLTLHVSASPAAAMLDDPDALYVVPGGDGDEEREEAAEDDAAAGDPSSPLHLPAVAFEHHAAEAAVARDIRESSVFVEDQLPRQQPTERVPDDGMGHMHDISLYGGEGSSRGREGGSVGINDSFDSALATNTLTDVTSGTPMPSRSYNPDFADMDSIDEAAELTRRMTANAKARAVTLLVPAQTYTTGPGARPAPLSRPTIVTSPPRPQRFDTDTSSSSSSTSSSSSASDAPPAAQEDAQHPLA